MIKSSILFLIIIFLSAGLAYILPYKKIVNFIHRKSKIIFWLMILFFAIWFLVFGIYKHYIFQTNAWDLGIFTNAVWHYSHFQLGPAPLIHMSSELLDHFDIILIVISPLFWIFSSPYTLIIIEIIAVLAGAWPIFRLSQLKLKNDFLSIGFALSYLLYFGIGFTINFTFHPSSFIAPFIAYLIYFIEIDSPLWYWIFFALIAFCKESAPLYLFLIGLYIIFFKKRYFQGILSIILSAGWYFSVVHLIIPHFRHAPYSHFDYAQLGTNIFQCIKTVITRPMYVIKLFAENDLKRVQLFYGFGAFGFLGLFYPPFFIISLEMFAERFLSSNELLSHIEFHYGAPVASMLAISAIFGLMKILQLMKKSNKTKNFDFQKIKFFFGCYVIFASLFVNFYIQHDPPLYLVRKNFIQRNIDQRESIKKAIKIIPDNVSVSAQETFVPHLATRKEIYVFPETNNADYILLNKNYSTWPLEIDAYNNTLINLESDKQYKLIFQEKDTLLFQKQSSI